MPARSQNLCNFNLSLHRESVRARHHSNGRRAIPQTPQSASFVLRKPERINEKRQCGPTKQTAGQRAGHSVFELVRRHLGVSRRAWLQPQMSRYHLGDG